MDYSDLIRTQLDYLAGTYRHLCQTVIDTARTYEGEWHDKHVGIIIDVLRGIPVPVMKQPEGWEQMDQAAYREAYRVINKPNWSMILSEYIEQAKSLKQKV